MSEGAKPQKVAVIGAGIAGLTAAYELQKTGADVHVFESSGRTGGSIDTVRDGGYIFERGPNSFPDSSVELRTLAGDLGIEGEIIDSDASAAIRLLYAKGRLERIPSDPRSLMDSRLYSWAQKMRIFGELLVPKGPADNHETVARFFSRRFGSAPVRTLVDAFVSGVFAGDARKIGMKAAFPTVFEMEQEYGSIIKALKARAREGRRLGALHTFASGMSRLTEVLTAAIRRAPVLNTRTRRLHVAGDGIYLSLEQDGAVSEERFDGVIIATPSEAATRLLGEAAPVAADLIVEIETAPLVSVHAGFDEAELPSLPHAFGYLVPRPQRMRTLGWLFSSRIFAGRAPEGKLALTGFIGGISDVAIMNAKASAVQHIMLGELSLALRMSVIPRPDFFHIVRCESGLPQYAVGHERRIDAVRHVLGEVPGLKLAGNYLNGISLNECVKSAQRAVRELLAPSPVVRETVE